MKPFHTSPHQYPLEASHPFSELRRRLRALSRGVFSAPVAAIALSALYAPLCLAQTVRTGEIFSPSPCFLRPAQADQMCAQYIIPFVQSTFQLHPTGSGVTKRIRVTSDDDGRFEFAARKGRYRIKLLKLGQPPAAITAGDLRAVPRYVTIGRKQKSIALTVVHKSYTDPKALMGPPLILDTSTIK